MTAHSQHLALAHRTEACLQPFLAPVPPVSSDVLATILLPFGLVLGVIRTALIVALSVLYALLVGGICAVLVSLSVSFHQTDHKLTADCRHPYPHCTALYPA